MRTSRPSAFSDSPEDLIRRAQEFASDNALNLPNEVVTLLVDISRALEKERIDRAMYTNMAREAASGESLAGERIAATEKLLAAAHRMIEAQSELLARPVAHAVRYSVRRLALGLRRHAPTPLADLITIALGERAAWTTPDWHIDPKGGV